MVSREISLRDKLSFSISRLFQVMGTSTLSVVALLEHELLCTCGLKISFTTCVSLKFAHVLYGMSVFVAENVLL